MSDPEVVDELEMEFRQFVVFVTDVLGRTKIFTAEGLKKWKARRKTWSAREIAAAFANLKNESDRWKIHNLGHKELSWSLRSDDYLRELQNCHLKGGRALSAD